jgi:hypothetical protein
MYTSMLSPQDTLNTTLISTYSSEYHHCPCSYNLSKIFFEGRRFILREEGWGLNCHFMDE